MALNIKAALLSGLVCPGLGQLACKAWVKGLAMLIPAVVIVFVVLRQAVDVANQLSQRILNGDMAPNIAQITAELHKAISPEQSQTMSIMLAVFLLIWLVSVIDGLMLETSKPNTGSQ